MSNRLIIVMTKTEKNVSRCVKTKKKTHNPVQGLHTGMYKIGVIQTSLVYDTLQPLYIHTTNASLLSRYGGILRQWQPYLTQSQIL